MEETGEETVKGGEGEGRKVGWMRVAFSCRIGGWSVGKRILPVVDVRRRMAVGSSSSLLLGKGLRRSMSYDSAAMDEMEKGTASMRELATMEVLRPPQKFLKDRRYVRVGTVEAVGLAAATGVISGAVGSLMHSVLYGGIAGGATILAWYVVRLFWERINHKEIERTLAAWDRALKEMTSILNALVAKTNPSKLKNNLVLYLAICRLAHANRLKTMESKKQLRGMKHARLSESEVNTLLHASKFAFSSYGPLLLLLGMMDISVGMSSREIVKKYTALDEEEILVMDLEGERINYPRHFIAIDHSVRAVVLSIRGTLSLSDVATDIVCSSTEYLGGYAHDGMKQSAKLLWAVRQKVIVDALANNPGYAFWITGHSLGAGAAVLLTLKLKMEDYTTTGLPKKTDVKCFAFASPPVFGPLDIVPRAARKAITSLRYRDDVVPSLSFAAVTALLHGFKRVDDLSYDLPSLLKMMSDKKVPPDVVEALDSIAEEAEHHPDLGVPGRRLWIWSATDCRELAEKSFVDHLTISDTMVTNHFPNAYEKVLTEMQDDFKGHEKNTRSPTREPAEVSSTAIS